MNVQYSSFKVLTSVCGVIVVVPISQDALFETTRDGLTKIKTTRLNGKTNTFFVRESVDEIERSVARYPYSIYMDPNNEVLHSNVHRLYA